MKNQAKKRTAAKTAKPASIKFHISLPADINAAVIADAQRAGRSRRRHITYLLTKFYEQKKNEA